MRRLTTGWEAGTRVSDFADNAVGYPTNALGYNTTITTSSPISGSNSFRAYRASANAAYTNPAIIADGGDGITAAQTTCIWTAAIGGALTNTVANPTVVTTTVAHNLANGATVNISGSNCTPTIDGQQTATVLTTTTFSVAVNVTVAGTAGVVHDAAFAVVGDAIHFVSGENAYITARNNATRTLTVTRGINGTTAAIQAEGTAITRCFSGNTGGYVEIKFTEGGPDKVRAQQLPPGVASYNQSFILDYNNDQSRCWVSFKFNVAVAPASVTSHIKIFEAQGGGVTQASVHFNNGGGLVMAMAGGSNIVLFTPTIGTTYRCLVSMKGAAAATLAGGLMLSVNIFENATNTLVVGKVATTGGFNGDIDRIRLGTIGTTGIAMGHGLVDVKFDDLIVNDNMGVIHNHAPGYSIVRGAAVPTAEGTTTDFVATGVAAPNAHQNVDDWGADPFAGADYNTTPAAAAIAVEEYDHTTTTTLGVLGTVLAVQVWVAHKDEPGEDGANHSWGMLDVANNELFSTANLPISGTDAEQIIGMSIGGTGSTGETAWTNSEFDSSGNNLYIKHTSATANQRKRIHAIRCEVEEDGGQVTIGGTLTHTVANPTVVTTTVAHNLRSGDKITISGNTSTPDLDGTHQVTVLTTTTFSIPVNTTVNGGGGSVKYTLGIPTKPSMVMNQGAAP